MSLDHARHQENHHRLMSRAMNRAPERSKSDQTEKTDFSKWKVQCDLVIIDGRVRTRFLLTHLR